MRGSHGDSRQGMKILVVSGMHGHCWTSPTSVHIGSAPHAPRDRRLTVHFGDMVSLWMAASHKRDCLHLAHAFCMLLVALEVQSVRLRGTDDGLGLSLTKQSSKPVPHDATQNFAFSIAPEKWRATSSLRGNDTKKTMLFSPYIPGRTPYVYHTEAEYYEQYSKAFFGITMKKELRDHHVGQHSVLPGP